VLVESDGPIRILTLNRPNTLNAFDDELHRELPRVLADLDRDREARAIVLTGAGRAFSAGGDLSTFEPLANDLELRRQTLRAGRRLFDELTTTHLPIVAAVNGPAVGLGATVVTACDMVFMSESAFLADPHVTVALVAGDGAAATWPLHMSLLRAKEFLLTGDRLDAQRALELGMANRVVPAESLMDEALAFAHRIGRLPPQAVQDTKVLLNQWIRQAAVSMLGFGLAAESQSHDTAEFRAVPEKLRKPARAND
jgi:enoyl-CoA hydratase/carnithine racemase